MLSPLLFSTPRGAPASSLWEMYTHSSWQSRMGEIRKEQRSTEGRGHLFPHQTLLPGGKTRQQVPGQRQLTIWEPPPRSWPGGPGVLGTLLVAGRDGARGKCLWAGQAEAPGGHVTPSLSQVGWLTGLAPQSCFNEKPRGLSARGPRVGTEARKSLDREQLLSRWTLGLTSSWSASYNSPADVPGAS